jgi:hypothetical protein
LIRVNDVLHNLTIVSFVKLVNHRASEACDVMSDLRNELDKRSKARLRAEAALRFSCDPENVKLAFSPAERGPSIAVPPGCKCAELDWPSWALASLSSVSFAVDAAESTLRRG